MIVELGHFALILAFAVSVFQTVVPLVGAHKGWPEWMAAAAPAASAQFLLTAVSFGALTIAFVTSDFSVALVTNNSHTLKPLLYKITGVWGNHEGSLLLWVLILTLFGASAAWFGGNLPPRLRARVLGVQSLIGLAFFALGSLSPTLMPHSLLSIRYSGAAWTASSPERVSITNRSVPCSANAAKSCR